MVNNKYFIIESDYAFFHVLTSFSKEHFLCVTGKMATNYSKPVSSLLMYSSSFQKKKRHLSQWL